VTVLGTRALNRAALARQFLLERAELPALDAVAHLGGLQAQEPQEPFTGLWSRLAGFDPAELSALLVERRVVRTHLMRRTVHLVTADDALAWRSRHDAMLLQRMLGVYRAELTGVDLAALAEAGRELLAQDPSTLPAAGRVLAQRWPDVPPRVLGEAVSVLVPLVQVPPRGLWGRSGPASGVALATWLGRACEPPSPEGEDPVGEALVLRYLAAFGPAATADLRAWSGLAGLPPAVARVRERLVAFRDERGRELLDLPDAPRPDPGSPAPVRFLPAFDNLVLGYDDRSRFIDDAHRGLSVAGTRFVLVDGRVAASWTVADGVVTVTPLRRFSRADRHHVGEEGRALAAFLSGGASHRVTIAASPR
jgi:hypothetical protein